VQGASVVLEQFWAREAEIWFPTGVEVCAKFLMGE
jgi:hypothetical protein